MQSPPRRPAPIAVAALSLALALPALAADAPAPSTSGGARGAASAPWPQYRGPNRDGVSPETGLAESWPEAGPRELWRARLGDGYSGIAVAGGRAYTLFGRGDDELAVAFDAATGEEIWRFRLDANRKDNFGDGPRSTPTVDGDTVYVLGAKGKLYALDAARGTSRWRRDLVADHGGRIPTWGVATSPLVDGDRLLVDVGSADGRSVVALDKRTGERVWASQSDLPGYSSPLIVEAAGKRQAIFLTGTGMVSVSPTTGERFWRVPWKTSYDVNAAMPIFLPPDRLFISTGYDVGAAVYRLLPAGDGVRVEEVWKSRVMKNKFNSSVLVDGHLYGFDDSTLKCIEAATGEEKWRQRGFQFGSLLAADGHLIILGERGSLALAEASPAGYKEKARAQLFQAKTWTMPTLAEGRLYVRSESELVALDVSEPRG